MLGAIGCYYGEMYDAEKQKLLSDLDQANKEKDRYKKLAEEGTSDKDITLA